MERASKDVMSELPEQLTKAQKLRGSLTWLSAGVFWVVITTAVSYGLHHHFPNIDVQTAITIEGAIGAPLSGFLAYLFYRLVLVKKIHESK
jgi:hypothetical protein